MNPHDQAKANAAYQERNLAAERAALAHNLKRAWRGVRRKRYAHAVHSIEHAFKTALILAPFEHCFRHRRHEE